MSSRMPFANVLPDSGLHLARFHDVIRFESGGEALLDIVLPDIRSLLRELRPLLASLDEDEHAVLPTDSPRSPPRWTLSSLRIGIGKSRQHANARATPATSATRWSDLLLVFDHVLDLLDAGMAQDQLGLGSASSRPPFYWLIRSGSDTLQVLIYQAKHGKQPDVGALSNWCATVIAACANIVPTKGNHLARSLKLDDVSISQAMLSPLERALPLLLRPDSPNQPTSIPLDALRSWSGRPKASELDKSVGRLRTLHHYRSKKAPFYHEYLVASFASDDEGAVSWVRVERAARAKATAFAPQADSSHPALSGVAVRETVTFASSLSALSSNSNELATLHALHSPLSISVGVFINRISTTSDSNSTYQLFTTNCRWFSRRAFLSLLHWCEHTNMSYTLFWKGQRASMPTLRAKLTREWFGGAQIKDRRSKALDFELLLEAASSKSLVMQKNEPSSSAAYERALGLHIDAMESGDVDAFDKALIKASSLLARAVALGTKDVSTAIAATEEATLLLRPLIPSSSPRPDAVTSKAFTLRSVLMQQTALLMSEQRVEEAIAAVRAAAEVSAVLGPIYVVEMRIALGGLLCVSDHLLEGVIELKASSETFKLHSPTRSWSDHFRLLIPSYWVYAEALFRLGREEESYTACVDGISMAIDLSAMAVSPESKAEASTQIFHGLNRLLKVAQAVDRLLPSFEIMESTLPFLTPADRLDVSRILREVTHFQRDLYKSDPDGDRTRYMYAVTLLYCAEMLSRNGRGNDSFEAYNVSIQLLSVSCDDSEVLLRKAHALQSFGVTLRSMGQNSDAESRTDEAAVLYQQLDSLSPSPQTRRLVRQLYAQRAHLLSEVGRHRDSVLVAMECEQFREKEQECPDQTSLACLIYSFCGSKEEGELSVAVQAAERATKIEGDELPTHSKCVGHTMVEYAKLLPLLQLPDIHASIDWQPLEHTLLAFYDFECSVVAKTLGDAITHLLMDIVLCLCPIGCPEVALLAINVVIRVQTSLWDRSATFDLEYEDIGRTLHSSLGARADILYALRQRALAKDDLSEMINISRAVILDHKGLSRAFVLRLATDNRDDAMKAVKEGKTSRIIAPARRYLAYSRLALEKDDASIANFKDGPSVEPADRRMGRVLSRFAWLAVCAQCDEDLREVMIEGPEVTEAPPSLAELFRAHGVEFESGEVNKPMKFDEKDSLMPVGYGDDGLPRIDLEKLDAPLSIKARMEASVFAASARISDKRQDYANAVQNQQSAVAIFRRVTGVPRTDSNARISILAWSLDTLALYQRKAGLHAEALQSSGEAIELYATYWNAHQSEWPNDELQHVGDALSQTFAHHECALRALGRKEEAAEVLDERNRFLHEKMLEYEQLDGSQVLDRAISHYVEASKHLESRKVFEAMVDARQYLLIARLAFEMYGRDLEETEEAGAAHADDRTLEQVLFRFAKLATEAGEDDDAEEALVEASALLLANQDTDGEKTIDISRPSAQPGYDSGVISSLLSRAILQIDSGAPLEGLRIANDALERCEVYFPDDFALAASVFSVRARALDGCHRHAEAIGQQREVIRLEEEIADATGNDTQSMVKISDSRAELAKYLQRGGHHSTALTEADVAIVDLIRCWKRFGKARESLDKKHEQTATILLGAYARRTSIFYTMGRTDDAHKAERREADLMRMILDDHEKSTPSRLLHEATGHRYRAIQYALQGNQQEAIEEARRYLLIARLAFEQNGGDFTDTSEAARLCPLDIAWSLVVHHFCEAADYAGRGEEGMGAIRAPYPAGCSRL